MESPMLEIIYICVFFMDGVVYAFISFDFMNRMQRTIFAKKRYYVMAFVLYAAAVLAASVFFGPWNVAVGVVGMLLIQWLLFSRQRMRLLQDVIYQICIICCQSIATWAVLTVCVQWQVTFQSAWLFTSMLMLIKQFACLAFSRVLIFFFCRHQIGKLSAFSIMNFIILPVLSMVLIVVILYLADIHVYLYGDFYWIVLSYLLILGMNLYVTYVFDAVWVKQQLRHELTLSQQQSQLQYEYYESLEQKYQDSRKLIHDMKNHLLALNDLYTTENENGARYQQELLQMMDSLGQACYTGHQLLNVILNEKLKTANALGIKTEIQIHAVPAGLTDVDVTAIFSNLLDNALEACKEIEGERYLSLKIDRHGDFLIVKMRNSMKGRPQENNGKFRSTKAGHPGIGLSNVRRTVEKYGGTCRFCQEAGAVTGEFQTDLVIPVEETGEVEQTEKIQEKDKRKEEI
ncbi:sensor histidine kinase [Diplocloster agilis]|uniref:sensor histidine kinase n=1 Tax=Diplocloster agilis TaxID=2850323 RepID=UPI0008218748|nr:sensor histidine kinase [Suonthocola fibrivorans]MCU6733211.1 GHKL domain-containing protein [Suonthocola fibrivorans]SCI81293.1 Sensor histidine kinase DpiB [uncultured Clostridium sp.]